MTQNKHKSRLGKGLSALIGAVNHPPVQVYAAAPEGDPGAAVEGRAAGADEVAAVGGVGGEKRRADGGEAGDGAAGLVMIALSDLTPNRFQPRQAMEAEGLEALAASVRANGLMQPIVVRPISRKDGRRDGARDGGGSGGARYEIVAGERRWRAAGLAGLERAPAIVREIDDRTAAEWALIENLQREDLNPMDRASAFRGLSDRFGLTQARIAERVGLDRSTVANLMRLTELEPELQSLVRESRLTLGHAKVLLAMPEGAERRAMGILAAAEQWSVRALEEEVEQARSADKVDLATRMREAETVAPARLDLERQIGEHLGTKVRIVTNAAGNRGRIIVQFYGMDHFDGLMSRFGFELRP